ncbi:PDDEXK nuclease domain-containing protein [Larkinella sp. GY13]|uniref:PDDEXK nuclease domain-containing protein n=1 Tax=Larkinella sp. GY13 TaxID=3453720 RepID=UPI003EE8358E
MSNKEELKTIDELISAITDTHHFFQNQAQKQVNVALTIRNWLFGFYISEYELQGSDRAQYGKHIMKEIAQRDKNIKGFSESNLYLFKQFYLEYPQIFQSLTGKLYGFDLEEIVRPEWLSKQIKSERFTLRTSLIQIPNLLSIDTNVLINRLSFTHIIELLKAETVLKRAFYETEAIKNNWSVRQLQRAMNSMLFERTGLSTDKPAVLAQQAQGEGLKAEDVFRNPYILEFLGLEEKADYSETDLEVAIINHLQTFLLEVGRGFCFEARQKRITFDNTHYRIDLVFYHRILKCHILIDLKLGEFTHADAGQMNVYLNYYRENEVTDGDNPPVGIILCAGKNENLVRYATAGLSQQVFVSKYLINLPTEDELSKIIEKERQKIA